MRALGEGSALGPQSMGNSPLPPHCPCVFVPVMVHDPVLHGGLHAAEEQAVLI